jgi:N utilization substance protein A
MSKEILDAVRALASEKNISSEKLMVALEDALLSAYKKTPGAAPYALVEMDRELGDFTVWELQIPPELEAQLLKEQEEEQAAVAEAEGDATTVGSPLPNVDPETGEVREPAEPELDLEKLKPYEDQITRVDVTPDDFGRIAAQTAKQVILQRIREAERDMMFEEYRDRVGELITGIVQQSDSRYTLVQLRERVEALLPKSEQVDGERYDHSQRIKAVIKDVSASTKGPSIIVSRRDPELIKSLFELEVPEIADGLVEITNVAREPGYRSKIAVVSHADGVDPVGACVGPRGSRVRMVVSELRGEKIDIIPYNDEPARFVAKALSPARVREVLVDDEAKQATVIVPDDQLSLAIGREGQNARLAARLTGWRIDIRSETEFAQDETEHGFEEEEVQGRCAAILSNGRRCPNAALPGSRYCGLDTHQALNDIEGDEVAALSGEATEDGELAGEPIEVVEPVTSGDEAVAVEAPEAADEVDEAVAEAAGDAPEGAAS